MPSYSDDVWNHARIVHVTARRQSILVLFFGPRTDGNVKHYCFISKMSTDGVLIAEGISHGSYGITATISPLDRHWYLLPLEEKSRTGFNKVQISSVNTCSLFIFYSRSAGVLTVSRVTSGDGEKRAFTARRSYLQGGANTPKSTGNPGRLWEMRINSSAKIGLS